MVSFVRSIGAGIQIPAVSALFPQIVPTDQLTRVQGINQTLYSVLMLLSPAVGGVVLGTMGIIGALFLDVITASIAIMVLSLLHVERVARTTEATSVMSELQAGIAYTFNNKLLKLVFNMLWRFPFSSLPRLRCWHHCW